MLGDEKVQMQSLNDRLASYIDKVYFLDQQNQKQLVELKKLRGKGTSRVGSLYKEEIRDLRCQVDEFREKKTRVEVEQNKLAEEIVNLKEKLQTEISQREKARQDLDNATITKEDLEWKVESLKKEISFLKKLHEREIQELQTQPRDYVEVDRGMVKADFTDALRDARQQYENLASKNLHESEEQFKSKITEMEESLSLEKKTVGRMEEEIKKMNDKMAREQQKYQDLLNVKMGLDVEIATYRKMLDGAETRIATPPPNSLGEEESESSDDGSEPEGPAALLD